MYDSSKPLILNTTFKKIILKSTFDKVYLRKKVKI